MNLTKGPLSVKLDFRTKFLMTITTSTICISGTLSTKYPYLGMLVSWLPFLLVLFEHKYKMFCKGSIAVFLATLLTYVLVTEESTLWVFVIFFSTIVLRMMPGIMMGYYAVISTTMSDLVESLRRMRLPDAIIIPISVMFRFFYSVQEDYSLITDSMKMHSLTLKSTWKNPMKLMEYKLVPLLMTLSKTADDVAISAMTRGMAVGQRRTSISETRIGAADYVMMLLMLIFVLFYIRSIYA